MKTIFALTVIGLMSTPVFADDDRNIEKRSAELGLISLDEAQVLALKAKAGEVDDVELESRLFGTAWDYEFEIVDAEGKEWEVTLDAKTGEVRKVKAD